MLKKSKHGYYYLENLARQKGIIHGFSNRSDGDCNPQRTPEKNWRNVDHFLKKFKLQRKNLILMEQVHGNKIKYVNGKEAGKIIPGVDGLISKQKEIILGVNTADCIPVLFYDPQMRIIGMIHAGWQGLFKKIPAKMVDLFIKAGSVPKDIIVGVGPYVGGCSYEVKQQFSNKFQNKFGFLKDMVTHRKGKPYLDLGILLRSQLINAGVDEKKIEFSQVCTVCRNDEFFSFRKDRSDNHGGMLGIITLININKPDVSSW